MLKRGESNGVNININKHEQTLSQRADSGPDEPSLFKKNRVLHKHSSQLHGVLQAPLPLLLLLLLSCFSGSSVKASGRLNAATYSTDHQYTDLRKPVLHYKHLFWLLTSDLVVKVWSYSNLYMNIQLLSYHWLYWVLTYVNKDPWPAFWKGYFSRWLFLFA